MTYDIIGQCSISSASALRRPRCCSGLVATLPRLCRPGPTLAEPLGPDIIYNIIYYIYDITYNI